MLDTSMNVTTWECAEPLTEEAVRAKYPADKYRVSVLRYAPTTRVGGSTRPSICHVLRGAARYRSRDRSITVRKGEIATLPIEQFHLEVLGEDELITVMCWELA